MYTRNQILTIHENAQKYGGSFIRALTEALMRADQINAQKLQLSFSDDFEKYLYSNSTGLI